MKEKGPLGPGSLGPRPAKDVLRLALYLWMGGR